MDIGLKVLAALSLPSGWSEYNDNASLGLLYKKKKVLVIIYIIHG